MIRTILKDPRIVLSSDRTTIRSWSFTKVEISHSAITVDDLACKHVAKGKAVALDKKAEKVFQRRQGMCSYFLADL